MELHMLFSGKDLRKLIVPLMFEQLLAVLVGLVDTLMVSQSGEAAVAGVAPNAAISFLSMPRSPARYCTPDLFPASLYDISISLSLIHI